MRIGSVILVVWLVIGALAAYQRNYFSSETANCAADQHRAARRSWPARSTTSG